MNNWWQMSNADNTGREGKRLLTFVYIQWLNSPPTQMPPPQRNPKSNPQQTLKQKLAVKLKQRQKQKQKPHTFSPNSIWIRVRNNIITSTSTTTPHALSRKGRPAKGRPTPVDVNHTYLIEGSLSEIQYFAVPLVGLSKWPIFSAILFGRGTYTPICRDHVWTGLGSIEIQLGNKSSRLTLCSLAYMNLFQLDPSLSRKSHRKTHIPSPH